MKYKEGSYKEEMMESPAEEAKETKAGKGDKGDMMPIKKDHASQMTHSSHLGHFANNEVLQKGHNTSMTVDMGKMGAQPKLPATGMSSAMKKPAMMPKMPSTMPKGGKKGY